MRQRSFESALPQKPFDGQPLTVYLARVTGNLNNRLLLLTTLLGRVAVGF